MNLFFKLLYRVYQIFILLPVVFIDSIIVATSIMIICPLLPLRQSISFSSFMCRIWGKVIVRATLLPVHIEGEDNIQKGQSYIVVANHESCYDIFLIIGFFKQNLRWMMKASLMRIPFIGGGCRASGFIPVDTSTPSKVHETCETAIKSVCDGVSLIVFPEGRRTYTGEVGTFRRGAYMIADKLQLPVLPVTISGTYEVMPRQRDFHFARWHRLSLKIHKPLYPIGQGHDNIEYLRTESRKAITGSEE